MDINKSTGKLYDLTSIYAISEHNPAFLAKLILVFCDNISNDILLIKTAAIAENWPEVSHLVHKMKPSLAHFGVNAVKDLMISLEHPGNSDARYLSSLVNELDRVTSELLVELKTEFSDIFNQ